MPDFGREQALGAEEGRHIVGVDEVGRGTLAGPVTAAAVVFPDCDFPAGIDDSKRIGPRRRQDLYRRIMDTAIVAVANVDVETIDRINILQAAMLAMRRAIAGLDRTPDHALIDGNRIPDKLPCEATAVISGDSVSISIAAASIIAKVERDRLMCWLDRQHPEYGWADNKGYGTRQHMLAMRDHGITEHHRRSFAPVRNLVRAG